MSAPERVSGAHTPGPWTADARYSGAVCAIVDGGSRQVALACGEAPMHETEARGSTQEIQAANARLIASAPEMEATIARLTGALEEIKDFETERAGTEARCRWCGSWLDRPRTHDSDCPSQIARAALAEGQEKEKADGK